MKFCLLDANYDENKIELIGVDNKGRRVVVNDTFLPYFYATSYRKTKGVVKTEKVIMNLNGKKRRLFKVYVDLPHNVQKVADSLKKHANCYEYSVNFCKRYLIDKGFYPMDWIDKSSMRKARGGAPPLRVVAFDMEVIEGKIIMISFASSSSKGVITCNGMEKEIIKSFLSVLKKEDPHVIVTYNGDGCNFGVLQRRMDDLKISGLKISFEKHSYMSAARVEGCVHIDLFNFVNNLIYQQLASEIYTLAEVCGEILGKTKQEFSYEEITEMWEKNPKRLSEYCLKDSLLTLELSDRLLPQIFELSKISGQLPFDCSRLTYGLLVEWFLMRKAHEMHIVHPSQPHWNDIQKRRLRRFKGGYVKEPLQGMHDGISVFDFRSLYPSIIVTFNISPETLNCKCCSRKVPGLDYHFCHKRTGFVPSVLQEVLGQRQLLKKQMKKSTGEEYEHLNGEQNALKLVANSTYGIFGSPSARWYCFECGEAAAAYGRHFILKAISSAGNSGFKVIYGDTDSLFIQADERKACEFIRKFNKSLPGIMEMDYQGFYKRGIFVPQSTKSYAAKKRYALIDNDGVLTVRGLETVRRDWCDLARKLQHDVLQFVLQKREKDAVAIVKRAVESVRKRNVKLEDIMVRTQLGKNLEEYKVTGPHIEVAKRLRQEGRDVKEGMIISYIIASGKGSISQRAVPSDSITVKDYDIEYYIKNQILPVALRVLGVFGYEERDFLSGDLKKFAK